MNLGKYIASYFLVHLLVFPLATSLAAYSTGEPIVMATAKGELFASYDFDQYQAPRNYIKNQDPQKSKESASPNQDTPPQASTPQKVRKGDATKSEKSVDAPKVETQDKEPLHPSQWNKARPSTRFFLKKDESTETPQNSSTQNQDQSKSEAKKAADKKAADKKIADKKAADKKIADKKAATDKKIADKKAATDKKIADEKAAADKKAADKRMLTKKRLRIKRMLTKKRLRIKKLLTKKRLRIKRLLMKKRLRIKSC